MTGIYTGNFKVPLTAFSSLQQETKAGTKCMDGSGLPMQLKS